VGEKPEALEPFHPARVASRILGMGDVLGLIERAEAAVSADAAAALAEKIRKEEFTLEDFKEQLRQIRRMGPLEDLLGMIPGLRKLPAVEGDERELARIEAIINSMTPAERRDPALIDGSRRRRIARGSGTTAQAINQLLKQFAEMKRMMKVMARGPKGLKGKQLSQFWRLSGR
jgi:signal recognition particle subunit SRP54